MDRRVAPLKRVTSPAWGPLPPCKPYSHCLVVRKTEKFLHQLLKKNCSYHSYFCHVHVHNLGSRSRESRLKMTLTSSNCLSTKNDWKSVRTRPWSRSKWFFKDPVRLNYCISFPMRWEELLVFCNLIWEGNVVLDDLKVFYLGFQELMFIRMVVPLIMDHWIADKCWLVAYDKRVISLAAAVVLNQAHALREVITYA